MTSCHHQMISPNDRQRRNGLQRQNGGVETTFKVICTYVETTYGGLKRTSNIAPT
ncbi:hypothetical protein ARMSODRAFT_964060 [Armillaria solidipes]|uniref:Uncharacterized protein n=1 Tax=Armillaria solidipes TaxID=1076256 RepID=A0A2H3BFE9_9AGAR|nr:hypothetical protein ARMSODRAFT_964060 [Armillaria solidipes]